ncbi:DUF3016 domain-containing protein [Dokdonella soli]|uniref:DUF3016 domain-containing protein n=1 Tax=Dokdonella soli TaxID=529810 RepID=A0ABN1IL06_9GAMM
MIPAALALTTAGATALAKSEPPSRIGVDWTDPAGFADVRESACSTRAKPVEWLGELARHLRRRADQVLAPGQHLDVTITDIRRAGICEPWRGPRWDDIRIVKDIYPPSIDLRYTLTGSDGARLRGGEEKLRDPAFLNRSTPNRDDPLRYEKRLLDDWLLREFAAPRTRHD